MSCIIFPLQTIILPRLYLQYLSPHSVYPKTPTVVTHTSIPKSLYHCIDSVELGPFRCSLVFVRMIDDRHHQYHVLADAPSFPVLEPL